MVPAVPENVALTWTITYDKEAKPSKDVDDEDDGKEDKPTKSKPAKAKKTPDKPVPILLQNPGDKSFLQVFTLEEFERVRDEWVQRVIDGPDADE